MKTITTTVTTFENFKHVETIECEGWNRKTRNTYYVDGKKVTGHQRYIAEQKLLSTNQLKVETTCRETI